MIALWSALSDRASEETRLLSDYAPEDELKIQGEENGGKAFTGLDRHGTHGLSDGRALAQGGPFGRDLEPDPRQGRTAGEKGRADCRSPEPACRRGHRVHDGVGRQGSRTGLFRPKRPARQPFRSAAENPGRLLID